MQLRVPCSQWRVKRGAVALLAGALLSGAISGLAQDDALSRADALYAELLRAYVQSGKVDYRGLKSDRRRLEECASLYGAVSMREFMLWPIPKRLAFLINVYNVNVLKIIVDDYPVTSIRKTGGWFGGDPFERGVVRVLGGDITLNLLANNYILRDYSDPRALFGLCQGARASPPLRAEPYSADRLYDQLADQARIFLSTAPYNHIDVKRRRMELSPIFEWYERYVSRYPKGLEGLIRDMAPPEWGLKEVPKRFSIRFTEFDWRLNDLNPSN